MGCNNTFGGNDCGHGPHYDHNNHHRGHHREHHGFEDRYDAREPWRPYEPYHGPSPYHDNEHHKGPYRSPLFYRFPRIF